MQTVLISGLGITGVVVGHDFEFGQKRAGNLATLTALGEAQGFSVSAFDTVTASGDEKISSTLIRQLLKQAKPEQAARLLGHPWVIEARVEHGDARGRKMGFPTANMHLVSSPGAGLQAHAAQVTIMDGDHAVARHDGVANFGIRPMYQVNVPLLETHLFDFDGDLYGKYLHRSDPIHPARSQVSQPAGLLIDQITEDAAKGAGNPDEKPLVDGLDTPC